MTQNCPLRRDFKNFSEWWQAVKSFHEDQAKAESEKRKRRLEEIRKRRRATHYDEREQRKTVEAWKRIKGKVLKRKAERESKERV